MSLYKNKYRVETTRRVGYDYSTPGYYFFTVVIKDRENLLGQIEDANLKLSENNSEANPFYPMVLNDYGNVILESWNDLPNHYSNCILDTFIIMPNHIHGIIYIHKQGGHSLSEIIRALKSYLARRINELKRVTGIPIWQSRFHDRIIRDEVELYFIREYIQSNPINWENDELK
jgi:REP element-mobilizing transposase RayT